MLLDIELTDLAQKNCKEGVITSQFTVLLDKIFGRNKGLKSSTVSEIKKADEGQGEGNAIVISSPYSITNLVRQRFYFGLDG